MSPTRGTPFPFRPVHAWLVWCCPACVWSVYGQVAAAAAVWSVRSCLGRLMVGLVWWVSSRCCRWSCCRMLFAQPARPCRRWLVASWLVQVWRSAVCQRWLAAFVMVELRCSVVFLGMVVSARGAPRCCHPVGCRSRFDPCTPGWFGVGRLACGLFTVMWRLQLRCGWCAVVVAASWSAGFVWVQSRCCRWSYRQIPPV